MTSRTAATQPAHGAPRGGRAAARDAAAPVSPAADDKHDDQDEGAKRDVEHRLTHRAHIIDIGTESWRFRHGLPRHTKKGA